MVISRSDAKKYHKKCKEKKKHEISGLASCFTEEEETWWTKDCQQMQSSNLQALKRQKHDKSTASKPRLPFNNAMAFVKATAWAKKLMQQALPSRRFLGTSLLPSSPHKGQPLSQSLFKGACTDQSPKSNKDQPSNKCNFSKHHQPYQEFLGT